LHIPSDLISA
jgi:hypothetical protein